MVEDLINSRVCDGQLDDCALTVRDLAKVKDSFCATLRSMMHTRIDYPKEDERSQLGRKSDLERRSGGPKTQTLKPVSAPAAQGGASPTVENPKS